MNFLTSDGVAVTGSTVVRFHNPHSATIQSEAGYIHVTDDGDVERLWVKVWTSCYPHRKREVAIRDWEALWKKVLCAACEERTDTDELKIFDGFCRECHETIAQFNDPMAPDYDDLGAVEPTSQYQDSREAAGL